MELITAKKKDDLLKVLVENYEIERRLEVKTSYILELVSLEKQEVYAILSQFFREGLITHYTFGSKQVSLAVTEPAHRKLLRGGYQLEELLLEKEMKKLLIEVERLEKKYSKEDLSTLTGIVANVTDIMTSFFQR